MPGGTQVGRLGKLFGRQRARHAAPRPGFARLNVEPLEDRRVLAVTAAIVGGDLVISSDGGTADQIEIRLTDGAIEVFNTANGKVIPVDESEGPFTSGKVNIDLGNGNDTLILPLIRYDGQNLHFDVDMGGGNSDVIILRENIGSGEFLPNLDLTSDTIRIGGANGSQYDTSGLTLNGAVRLEGPVTITTGDGDFDASGATIAPGIVGSTPAANASLTIESGKGDVLIGAMDDTSDVLIQHLSITSGGDVRFVAGTGPTTVESLSVDAATITVNRDIDVTDGDTTLQSTGVITFGDVTVDTHGNDLTLITGVTGADPFVIDPGATFAGGTATIQPQSDATPIEIGDPMMADPMALPLDPVDLQRLAGFSAIEIGSDQQSGTITVFEALTLMNDSSAVDLHLNAGSGDIFVNAVVNVDGDVTVTGDGNTTTINADMMGAALTFNDDVRIGTDMDGITLTAAAGGVTFNNTVDSVAGETNPLTVVTMGGGHITFGDAVGASDPLASLTANSAGQTRIDGNITTTGAQSYGGDVRLDSTVTLATTDSDVLFSGTVNSQMDETNSLTINAGGGAVTFSEEVGDVEALGALAVNSTGVTRFNSTVEAASLTTNAGGSTQLNDDVTTSGSQTYGDSVRIDGSVELMTTNSPVLFSSTVDSQATEANTLTINAGSGNITFTAAVGAAVDGALGAMIVNSTGTTRFGGSVQAASLSTNAGGTTQLNGNVTTGGAQNYGDAVRIDADLVLTTTNNSQVLFSNTVNSESGETNDLTINTGSGNITFMAAVGAGVGGALGALAANSTGTTLFNSSVLAASLTTNAGGSTQLNGNVTTTGAQTYGDNVRIDADIALMTTNSNVQFSGTVNSQNTEANDLTIAAGTGDIGFSGAVGDAMGGELGAVRINSAGDVSTESTFEAGSLVQAAGTGTTTIGGAMTLGAAAGLDLSTGTIVINALVDVRTAAAGGVVRLAASDDVTLNAEIRSGTGTVDVLAGDDVTFGAAGLIDSTSGVVTVRADANGDVNGAGGAVFMNDGARIVAGSGRIVISADEDITLGGLQTTSTASNAVQLTSTSGGIVDGGDTHRDVVAAGGGLVIDAETGVGSTNPIETTVASLDVANTQSGNIQIAELDSVSLVQLSLAGAGNIVLTTGGGSITVAATGAGVSAGTGTVTLSAGGTTSDILLNQDITTAATGSVSLTAGRDILDDGIAATRITTGNLSLSATARIGVIDDFDAALVDGMDELVPLGEFVGEAGTPIDVSLSGQLLTAETTGAGGQIFVHADGDLTAAPGAINPAASADTVLIVSSGNLNVGVFDAITGAFGVTATPGGELGLIAGQTLTLPFLGLNVGPAGTLRLRGDAGVNDGDQFLGTFTANSLEFISGSAGQTVLFTDVTTLSGLMTQSNSALLVAELDTATLDGITLGSLSSNNGNLLVTLAASGNIMVNRVDAGTGVVALVASPIFFTGVDGAIVDAGMDDNVDVTGGQVLLLASLGIGTDANALEVDADFLAALTASGDVHITDVGDGLTIGTVVFPDVTPSLSLSGVQITGSPAGIGGDITVSATGPSGNLVIDAAVVTVGDGAISLAAAGDVSLTAAGQVATVAGGVLVDADGGITMADGSAIVTTGGGAIELTAENDVVIGRLQATQSEVLVTSGGAIVDGGNTGGADITANQAALSAASGIGTTDNAIETQVNVLSAANSSSGDIAITNAALLAWTSLTIGDVGGLTGIENTAAGGAINLTNFGTINVNSAVQSAGNVTLTAENAFIVIPVLPPIQFPIPSDLAVNAQVLAAGAIVLNAGNNLLLNDTGEDSDVHGDSVTGSAGNLVIFGPNVIVRSDSGAVADKVPNIIDVDVMFPGEPPFSATATIEFGRDGEENQHVSVNFNDVDMAMQTFASLPADRTFTSILPLVSPDTLLPVVITITVTDAPDIAFFENGVETKLDPIVREFPIAFDFVIISTLPRAEFAPPPPPAPALPAPDTAPEPLILQGNNFDDLSVQPDAPPAGDERIIIIEKVDADGFVEKDRNGDDIQSRLLGEEAEEVLADPSRLFQKLKSGRFQIWLKDGAEAERNLIWDVILRDGKPESGAGGTQRLPTEVPAEAPPDAPPAGGEGAAVETSETGIAPPSDTGAAPAEEEAAATAAGDRVQDGESPTGTAAPAAAAAGLLLPGALRHLSRYGRQMACTVCACVSTLLRNLSS